MSSNFRNAQIEEAAAKIEMMKHDKDPGNFLWMEVGDVTQLNFENKLIQRDWEDPDNHVDLLVEMCRDTNYLHFITKYILNIDLLPFQTAELQILFQRQFPMLIGSRGAAKSYIFAVYSILRSLVHQGCKIAVVGASFRQSLVIFNYIQTIWNQSPILRDICSNQAPKRDIHMAHWTCGISKCIFLPLGSGETIRGQRANVVIGDEFGSISSEVFETVVRGFAAVKSDGMFNSVVEAYKRKELGRITGNVDSEENLVQKNVKNVLAGNQIIIGGTAGYHFNHFYKYYCYYKELILSGGDKVALKQKFPEMPIPEGKLDVSQYAIIRIPAHALPPGMMDENILAQGQATMDPQIFLQEYCCVFSKDSDGFFLASALNRATCPIQTDTIGTIEFGPMLSGDPDKVYVMGIDPASEDDDFAIGIAELNDTYSAYVYQFTTNRKDFEELRRNGFTDPEIKDYHTFCVKHIRSLCRRFNVRAIFLDAGGGGLNVREGLRDPDKLLDSSDTLIYDMDDEDVQGLQGRHILKMIEFQSAAWRKSAHYELKKDILDLKILFPKYDAVAIEMSIQESQAKGIGFDTLDECHIEIEQCKQQTAMIRHSATTTGAEKWDVPKIVGLDAEQIKRTLKRDRFTSLLLTNNAANWYRLENELSQPKQFTAVSNGMPHNIEFLGRNMGRFSTIPSLNLNGV